MKKHLLGLITALCLLPGSVSAATYLDNGDQTVTDKKTGLVWDQRETTAKTWEAALSYCETLTHGTKTDWRLPNRNELLTLVDYTKLAAPTINTTFFPGAVSLYYWTSTSYALGTSSAWGVIFSNGNVGSFIKPSSFYVRCVR